MTHTDISAVAHTFNISPSVHLSAAYNLELVREYMESHLGCTAKEVAHALDLSGDQARRAVRKIRSAWCGQ